MHTLTRRDLRLTVLGLLLAGTLVVSATVTGSASSTSGTLAGSPTDAETSVPADQAEPTAPDHGTGTAGGQAGTRDQLGQGQDQGQSHEPDQGHGARNSPGQAQRGPSDDRPGNGKQGAPPPDHPGNGEHGPPEDRPGNERDDTDDGDQYGPDDPRLADPASYADPDHPSYDYYARTGYESLAGEYLFDELFGCHVDHPYFRWLMDATEQTVREQVPTMVEALANGFVPLGPIPNDFGYPDTYWHWINYTHSRPRLQDRILEGAEPTNDRDDLVQPDELQHLLMVPAYWRYTDTAVEEGETTDLWITQGVMYATEVDPGPELYPGCNPFHSHSDIDTDHLHFWVDHHVHPLAMNPKHLCDEDGQPIESFYGTTFRDTDDDWYCYHEHADHGDDDHGGHDDGDGDHDDHGDDGGHADDGHGDHEIGDGGDGHDHRGDGDEGREDPHVPENPAA